MTSLRDVVQAWRNADPKHIHPTREHVSEEAYWESGRTQAEFILDLLPDGGTVLDFGCGDGRIAIPLAKLGFHVVAVDASPEMLLRLEHNIAVSVESGFSEAAHIHAFVWDGVDLQTEKVGNVDAVNARAVFIHHSHADIEEMVGQLAVCLKPGGYLVADWPIGGHHERVDWIDVTTWNYEHRAKVAEAAGLELVREGVPSIRPSVWRKL